LAELEALYLTQNALTQLPRSVGRLRRLRKLQAASNRLEALPDELALLTELVRPISAPYSSFRVAHACPSPIHVVQQELLRVPCNALRSLPAALGPHPTLTWLSYSTQTCTRPCPRCIRRRRWPPQTARRHPRGAALRLQSWPTARR
jgi:hypothetical protein